MYNNQGNYQQFGQRLPPPPPPPQYQQQEVGAPPYGPPASVPPNGMMNSSQSYSMPPPHPPQNSNWSQSQHISPSMPPHGHHPNPRIPPPQQQEQFYRVPPPRLPPPPSLGYFTPPPFGQVPPPPLPPSSPPPGPPPLPASDVNFMSDIPPPPPKPRDEKIVRKIELLCHYIAKNGAKFEDMMCQKEVNNPEFVFLFGGPPGSEAAMSHEYFKWMKKKCGSSELREGGHTMDMSLKPSVVGTLHEGVSHSPAGSDMDMEDDITQPEEPGNRKSFGTAKHEPALSNQVDIAVEEHAKDGNVICSEPSGMIKLGTNLSKDDMQFEKSKEKIGAAESERSLDSKTEQSNTNIHQEINQSVALTEARVSPFILIQGYNSSESDNDPHFQNISPEAVSRQPKAESDNEFHFENTSPEPVSPQFKEHDIDSKNSPQLDRESRPLSVPVVEASLNISSKISETSVKQNDRQKGDDTAGLKNGGAKRENSNIKSKVDEFGRIIREGSSDSGSDHYRRRSKRGRSRSRSRSPYGRRRRREKRSRSRSWSPRRRSRSRSPYRRNRNQIEVCLDNRRGKCFRESCRYFHEPDMTEEYRWHNNRYHEVSDKLRNTDKLFPEKNEINSQDVVKEEFVEPPGHFADVARGHEIKTLDVPSQSASADIDPLYQAPPSSVHPKLAPLPPPPHGGTLPQYQQYQFPLSTNYPMQTLIRPYPMNYPISQQPAVPMFTSPSLASSNLNFSQDPPAPGGVIQSRIPSHYNPYASTFDQPMSTSFSSGAFSQDTYGPSVGQNHIPDEGQTRHIPRGDQYDPLFDSFNPSSNRVLNVEANGQNKAVAVAVSEENDEFGETADAEVGAVENDSPAPSSPIDLPDMATGEVEIDQVRNSGKTKQNKDSRSMKLFKVSLAEFVKDVLKPSWKQGNMSKEAFKTIVKKTVDKVSGAMKTHQIPKSQAKINHYIDSSQRKLTKLVMGYVDKYVKV